MRLFLGVLFLMLLSGASSAQDMSPVPVTTEIIQSYPQPNATPLYVDENLLYDRVYRRVEGSLKLFDAPNGTLVDNLGTGYSFVTLSGAMTQGNWTQVAPDRWVPSMELSENVAISRYAGVHLIDEMPYPMGWTLRHLRPSATPGGDESPNNPFLYRYTRVNLYSAVELDGYLWYQVGEDQWIHQFNIAKVAPIERPEAVNTGKWVGVDLYEQVLIAYEDVTPVFATLISSGLSEWATNEGTFNVYIRYERTLMSGGYNQDDFYYIEEVPWTMYFDGEIGLHGTYWHDGFGFRQSHGCVNMSIIDAKWLYDWSADVRDFTVEDSHDLSVHVYSSGEYD